MSKSIDNTSFLIRYSASNLPKQTPWHNWNEWDLVKNKINGSIEEQKDAIHWMKLWSSRGNCPASVDSTCTFLELSHTLLYNSSSLSSIMIRNLIGMALVRFVNGIVDQAQKSQFAISMSFLAQKLDLSQSLVDVRHSATHSILPSLNTLLEEMNNALTWLKKYYWEQQSIKHKTSDEKIRNALLNYRLEASKFFKKDKIYNLQQNDSIIKVLEHCDSVNIIQDTLVPLLLENGCLLPAEDLLQSSLMKKWIINHFNSNNISLLHIENNKYYDLPLEIINNPPKPLKMIWAPLIDIFCETWPHFYIVLLESIVNMITIKTTINKNEQKQKTSLIHIKIDNKDTILSINDIQNLILCSWIIYLLEEYTQKQSINDNNKQKINKRKKKQSKKSNNNPLNSENILNKDNNTLQPNFELLWRQTSLIHNKYGRYLSCLFYNQIENIHSDTEISSIVQLNKQIEILMKQNTSILNGIYDNNNHNYDIMEDINDINDTLLSLEDFEEFLNCKQDDNNWKLCSDWEPCPIGCLPSGFPNLLLPKSLDCYETSNYIIPCDNNKHTNENNDDSDFTDNEAPPFKKQKISNSDVKTIARQTQSLLLQ